MLLTKKYKDMKLTEIKQLLANLDTVVFQLPNGSFVPEHFHVTEVGIVTKNFIDCGGTVREEKAVSFQLWQAADFDHRLAPSKLNQIIELSERTLNINPELEIEVEFQRDTIGKYGLSFNGHHFQLTSKLTACLAEDACGIPQEKQKVSLSNLGSSSTTSCCSPSPNSKCC
jgi:hypothetical protein